MSYDPLVFAMCPFRSLFHPIFWQYRCQKRCVKVVPLKTELVQLISCHYLFARADKFCFADAVTINTIYFLTPMHFKILQLTTYIVRSSTFVLSAIGVTRQTVLLSSDSFSNSDLVNAFAMSSTDSTFFLILLKFINTSNGTSKSDE